MKIRKKIALVFTAITLLAILSFTSCKQDTPADNGNNDNNTLPTTFTYDVTVTDPFGNPVADVVVKLLLNGESVKMKMTDADGKVSGSIDNGEYDIDVVSAANKSFYFDKFVLSSTTPSLTVVLYDIPGDKGSQELTYGFEYTGTQTHADVLTEGGYRVELKPGKNYFVFVAQERGEYLISTDFDKNVNLGYHGGVFFVQENDVAESDESAEIVKRANGIAFKVRSYNVGADIAASSKYVISVECSEETAGALLIKRVGDLELSMEERPWEDAPMVHTPKKFVLDVGEGKTLKDFDITDRSLTWVYNSQDGFYHLGSVDGPVLYMKLNASSEYAAAISAICETNGYGAYIYDDEGNFVSKRNYASLVNAYVAAADADYGVYPVTQDLYDFITNYGNQNGWWNASAELNHFFGSVATTMVGENAWLFAACYVTDEN